MAKADANPKRNLHRYPYFYAIISVAAVSVIGQILIILDCFFPLLELNVDAVSSVMSTCSEVVAGLYGITLTGYIFFADRFKDTPQDDESLYDAVQALLVRYNHMAGFISLLCMACIVLGEGIVLYGTNTLLPQSVYRFLINETLLMFFCTCNFILYFVISVLDPHKVNRISTQKKAKLSDDKTVGNMDEFIAAWGQIEDGLWNLQDNLIRTMRFVPTTGSKNKPQLVRTMETLRNYGRISHGLWRKLDKLRQYHNLALHDPSMTVSKEMCDLAQEVASELNAANELHNH